jgi:putative two-component system response regulator
MNNDLSGTHIMLVDDVESNLEVLEIIFLGVGASVAKLSDGFQAIDYASQNGPKIDLVITDLSMPGMDGIKLTTKLREMLGKHIPIVLLTANHRDERQLTEGLNAGANDYLYKPVNEVELLARSSSMVRLKKSFDEAEDLKRNLELIVVERTIETEITRDATMLGFAKLAELRDPETGGHIERIREYTKALAEHLQKNGPYQHIIDHSFVRDIYKASPLHDIGKVGIPDNVLLKPGKLDPTELEIMNRHAYIGGRVLEEADARLLTPNSFLQMSKEIAFCHHEKWDGTGYPGGIKGESIPLAARIMALVDIYDALVSKRVYKEAMSHEVAHSIIIKSSGIHLDPAVVNAYLDLESEFIRIKDGFRD